MEQLEKILEGVMTREEEIDNIQESSERFWSIKFIEEEHKRDPKPLRSVVLQSQDDGLFHQIALLDSAVRTKIKLAPKTRFFNHSNFHDYYYYYDDRLPKALEPGEELMVRIRSIDYKQNRFSVVAA